MMGQLKITLHLIWVKRKDEKYENGVKRKKWISLGH